MGVSKQEVIYESDGQDQLKQDVGKIVPCDKVTIHYKGRYATDAKTVEYEDTFHSEKKLTFVVGSEDEQTIIRGLQEAVQQMVLGEVACFEVSSDYGYGNKEHKGYVRTVPANSDLVLEVSIMAITRDGARHNRKQPVDNASLMEKILNCCCRAY